MHISSSNIQALQQQHGRQHSSFSTPLSLLKALRQKCMLEYGVQSSGDDTVISRFGAVVTAFHHVKQENSFHAGFGF